jgi:hypothetical protein
MWTKYFKRRKNKPTQKAKRREIQGKGPLPKKNFQTKIRKENNKIIISSELTEEEFKMTNSLN